MALRTLFSVRRATTRGKVILVDKNRRVEKLISRPWIKDGRDTYVGRSSATTNMAGWDYLRITAGGNHYNTLLYFDLSSIPKDSLILSAKLFLYAYRVADMDTLISVYRIKEIDKNWSEHGSTWNNISLNNYWAGDVGHNGGTDAGGNVAGTDHESVAMGSFNWPRNAPIGQEIQISLNTNQIKLLMANNYGLIIKSATSTSYGSVYSADSNIEAYRPRLEIKYRKRGYLYEDPEPIHLYVDASATPGNPGTIESPMTLQEALVYGLPPASIVYLNEGIYTGNFGCYLYGKKGKPIKWTPTVRGMRVTIDGSMTVGGNNNWFNEIEFTNTGFTDRTSTVEIPSPPDLNGTMVFMNNASGTIITNCHLKNGENGYNTDHMVDGGVLYGNIIMYNGWYIYNHTWGHGVYAHSIGTDQFIQKHNVSLYNFGVGTGFGSNGSTQYGTYSNLENILLEGNISFEQGIPNGIYKQNLIVHCGGTIPLTRIYIKNNVTYTGDKVTRPVNPSMELMGNNSSYVGGTGEITNNHEYMKLNTSNGMELGRFTGPITGNEFMGVITGFDLNTYPDNTVLTSVPERVFIFPNEYVEGRANIAISNPNDKTDFTIDLSSVPGISIGDTIYAHNVEDYFNDIQTLTVDENKSITVNVEAINRTVEEIVGWTTPDTTWPKFGAFIIDHV